MHKGEVAMANAPSAWAGGNSVGLQTNGMGQIRKHLPLENAMVPPMRRDRSSTTDRSVAHVSPGARPGAILRAIALVALSTTAICAAHTPAWSQAVEASESDEETVLDEIVITSTRTPTDAYETLSGSSALSEEDLNSRYLNGRLPEIMTAIPGVSTQTSADDPGVAINLRGLQDFGRVNVLVDGARQNFQKNGHEANGTFYLDTQMLKSVDVTRGPVSSVYGSGAIGGVVSFTTLDSEDIIRPDAEMGARLRTIYDTNGAGPTLNAVGAARIGESADILLGGTLQKLGDYESGGSETINSAQEMKSGLAKARFRPASGHQFSLSASRYLSEFENGASTVRDTEVTADTYTGGYRYNPEDGGFWDFSAKGYFTETLFEQKRPGTSELEQSFDVGTTGFDVFNTSRFGKGEFDHELTYGGDLFRDNVETVDNIGSSDDLTPSGQRLAYGSFIQDRIKYGDWLEIIGGLRYDGYSLEGDEIEVEGERLSPKISVGITPWQPFTVYASYAEGYRAPALTETLIDGFHPPPVTGRFFPNPDLRPEIARTVEVGANLRLEDVFSGGDRLSAKVGVFQNDVDDYIDQVFMLFPIPGGYQYQNIAEARIRGIELEAGYDSGAIFASVSGQILDGENLTTGGPLQKVPPYRIVTSAGFRAFDEKLTVGGRVTVVGSKRDDAATGFIGEAYNLVDLFGSYAFNESVSADVALNNIFDRDYTQYLNADPSPGFNAKASLTMRF